MTSYIHRNYIGSHVLLYYDMYFLSVNSTTPLAWLVLILTSSRVKYRVQCCAGGVQNDS